MRRISGCHPTGHNCRAGLGLPPRASGAPVPSRFYRTAPADGNDASPNRINPRCPDTSRCPDATSNRGIRRPGTRGPGRGPSARRRAGHRWKTAIAALSTVFAVAPTMASSPPEIDPVAAAVAAARAATWVQAFDAPAPDDPAAQVDLGDVSGIRTALRARGRVVSEHVATVQPFQLTPDEAAAATPRLLRRSVGGALAGTLADGMISRLRNTLGDRIGQRLTMELEIAGPIEPLAGRDLERIFATLEPGLDGLALRRDDQVALRFPGQMLTRGEASDFTRALAPLLIELDLPLVDYPELRERFNVRLYRFRTVHFVQETPGATPDLRVRGHQLVSRVGLDAATVADTGRDLFNHLVSRLWAADQPIGMRGTYNLNKDAYSPAVAPPREQALVALAFAHWAGSSFLRLDDRDRAIDAALVVLEELRLVAPGEADPLADPLASAAVVLTEIELDRLGRGVRPVPEPVMEARSADDDDAAAADDGEPRPIDVDGPPVPAARDRAAFRAKAIADVTALTAVIAAAAEDERITTLLDEHDQAVLVAAATRHAIRPQGMPFNDAAELTAATTAIWESLPRGERLSLMPWIHWADIWRAEATGTPRRLDEEVRTMATVVETVQLGRGTAPELSGGFLLAGSAVPIAGAQSIRPTVMLAAILRDPMLTAVDGRQTRAARLQAAMRFMMQLTVRPADRWTCQSISRAVGGIRSAPWDGRMPLAAQAIGLMTYGETLRSLASIGAFRDPELNR